MPIAGPEWVHWDGDTHGQLFHGREITVFSAAAGAPQHSSTTYRQDYPRPPLYWSHAKKDNSRDREVPEFGGTTTHRAEFVHYPPGVNAPVRKPYPERQFAPKLSVKTEAREAFKIPVLPPPKPPKGRPAAFNTDAPIGNSTMRADYVQHPLPTRNPRAGEPPREKLGSKFSGSTTTRDAYPWPKEIPPPGRMFGDRPEHEVPEFEGTTTYRSDYEIVPVPPGLKADIGLQVSTAPYKAGGVGGQFLNMIRLKDPSPCTVSKIFTTVQDNQQTAAIVIVAKRPDYGHGVILGHFDLTGMKPERSGVTKIEVTLRLSNEKTLMASAFYRNGGRTKNLTFKVAKTGPQLRSVVLASDVPEDY